MIKKIIPLNGPTNILELFIFYKLIAAVQYMVLNLLSIPLLEPNREIRTISMHQSEVDPC